jgi:hypothetical protein
MSETCNLLVPGSLAGYYRHRDRGEQSCDACRKEKNVYLRARHDTDADRQRKIWTRYRLRPEDYEAILGRQNGVCAICTQPFKMRLTTHLDHVHGCAHPGRGSECCPACVRGILCNRCNHLLGGLDDREWLAKALLYLGRETADG